jgi:hypothetical protein
MTIRMLEQAGRDVIKGFHFYERQATGLGKYFLNSIYSDIDPPLIYHGIHPIKFDGYHCILSKRFPFGIYYTIEENTIYVQAILDCRQNPENTGKRLVGE